MTETTPRTTRTAAGPIVARLVYRISFACDTPGPEVEEGSVLGYWTGEVDTWGKLTIVPTGGGPRIYLFRHEFTGLDWE